MLHARGATIADPFTADQDLPPAHNLVQQLGGRYLLCCIREAQLGDLLKGPNDRRWASPTPYSPDEVFTHLAPLFQAERRDFFIMLAPSRLTNVSGPRWVKDGFGIEYILNDGFTPEAIVGIPPGADRGAVKWELRVW